MVPESTSHVPHYAAAGAIRAGDSASAVHVSSNFSVATNRLSIFRGVEQIFERVRRARDSRIFSQCKSKIVSEVTVSVGCELQFLVFVCCGLMCVICSQVRERLVHCFTELMKDVEQNLEARNR